MATQFIFGIYLLVLLSIAQGCPSGWITHESMCYHFSHDTEEWIGALNVCRELGGQLVEIETAEENQYLMAQAKLINKTFWIALSDLQEEGTWVWMNSKTKLSSQSYTSWAPGQPDNAASNENCVCLWDTVNFLWNDGPCHVLVNYICEKSNENVEVVG